jgi:hypothetical protein
MVVETGIGGWVNQNGARGKDSLIEEDRQLNEHAKGKLERVRWPLVGCSSLVIWFMGGLDLVTCERIAGYVVVDSHRGVEVVSGPVGIPEVVVELL